MNSVRRTVSSEFDPLVPENERTCVIRLAESEACPNPQGRIVREVWMDTQRFDLGECPFSRQKTVLSAINRYLQQHPTRLAPEAVEQLRQLVCQADAAPNASRPKTTKTAKTAKTPTKAKLGPASTLPLPLPGTPAGEDLIQALTNDYWHRPLQEVRDIAFSPDFSAVDKYHRSAAVRAYVLKRSEGQCESCGSPAPFLTPSGLPYLECHHTIRLADGGPDHPRWVIAICPTCHRRAHYATDGKPFNDRLKGIVQALEPNGR